MFSWKVLFHRSLVGFIIPDNLIYKSVRAKHFIHNNSQIMRFMIVAM